jgi:uncharacterized membrane protein YeaQ/YmgE (transglycosylase-associated protein family)
MIEVIVLILVALAVLWAISAVVGLVFGILEIAFLVLVWMFVGYLAGKVLRGKGYGLVGDLLLGVGGGLIGVALSSVLGVGGGLLGYIIFGVIGAVILVYGLRAVHDADFAR